MCFVAADAKSPSKRGHDSVRPHRRQPTRLLRPWDSPGKNTGVGCHFLLQREDKVISIAAAAAGGTVVKNPPANAGNVD